MAQGFPSNEVCSQLQANGKYKVLNEIPITHEQVDWRRDANHRGCNLQCHSKDRYIQGIMVEMRGTNESEPCDECKKGCGPFLDCRRLQLPNGEWALDGACANCWYRHHPEWCTCDDGPANSTNPPPAQAPVAVQQTPPPAPPALPLSSQTPYVEALQSRIQTKAPFEHNIVSRTLCRKRLKVPDLTLIGYISGSLIDLLSYFLHKLSWNHSRSSVHLGTGPC